MLIYLLQAAWILDESSDGEEGSVGSDEKMDANQDSDEDDGVVSEDRNDEREDMTSDVDGDDDGQSEMMVKCLNIAHYWLGHCNQYA